jgi:patatin-like phospholipase/acyl hydrolase
MKPFRILAIDGGGLRGIVPVRILQALEKRTNKKVYQLFDMMAGTSTGGLIAACLTLRNPASPEVPLYSLDHIAELYENRGKDIFPIQSGISKFFHQATNLFRPAYSASGIESVLKEYVSNQCIKDSLLPIIISTYDLNSNRPVFFKSSEAAGNEFANARIYDICRATSAAPTFLPAYSFQYKGKLLTGIDGGVYVNNPSMAALAEISRYGSSEFYQQRFALPIAFENVKILSLGTGSYTGTITETEAVRWGELQWISRITDIMMKGVNQSTDYETSEMIAPDKYLRASINIADKRYADMADARPETFNYLITQTEQQVISNTELMDKMISLVLS